MAANISRPGLQAPYSPSVRSPRPASSYSGFHLPSSSSSSAAGDGDGADSEDDDIPLPFPSALARRDFLAPDFDAASYLSSLFPSDTADGDDTAAAATNIATAAHRHQTLEDLRGELRERSTAISVELLELVNANYTSFLGLGDELKGGGERVEDVRVALLGFRRAVEEVKGRVARRREEVGEASRELGRVRAGVEMGRRMLELDERLVLLEGRLAVGSLPNGHERGGKGNAQEHHSWDADSESDEDEDDDGEAGGSFVGSSPAKLASLAREYGIVAQLADSIGRDLPYVKKMEERMTRCRNTILLDLGTAIREARKTGASGQARTLQYLAIYRMLGAQKEAVKALQER